MDMFEALRQVNTLIKLSEHDLPYWNSKQDELSKTELTACAGTLRKVSYRLGILSERAKIG